MAEAIGFTTAVQDGIHGYDVGPTNRPQDRTGFAYEVGGPDGWCAVRLDGVTVRGFKSRHYAGVYLTEEHKRAKDSR